MGPPIVLQHGIFTSSSNWVSRGDLSPAFLLVNAGYDVWLTNSRGNSLSKTHIRWDATNDKEFWDFSWDEMGKYDTPASIDYIIGLTGFSKISRGAPTCSM